MSGLKNARLGLQSEEYDRRARRLSSQKTKCQRFRKLESYDGCWRGHFTQEDPLGLGGGLNEYGFAGADPVNLADSFGLLTCDKDHPADCEKKLGPTLGEGCPAISDGCNSAPLVPKSGKEALAKGTMSIHR